jgi:hypothetical protein
MPSFIGQRSPEREVRCFGAKPSSNLLGACWIGQQLVGADSGLISNNAPLVEFGSEGVRIIVCNSEGKIINPWTA